MNDEKPAESAEQQLADKIVSYMYERCGHEFEAEFERTWEIELLYGLRTVGYEPGDEPDTFKRVFEPMAGPSTSVSDLWDLRGVESALKEAESALVSHDAMRAPEPLESQRVSPCVDICIKHRFRGTRAQPGCPECAASGEWFFLDLGTASNAQVMGWFDAQVHHSQPHRTFILTGITEPTPPADFDDTTEPSRPTDAKCTCLAFTHPDGQDGTFRNGCRVHRDADAPEEDWLEKLKADFEGFVPPTVPPKRSDERVPEWLEPRPSHFAGVPITMATELCGCITIHGITFSCIACAKGGG
jgi:hypothetical protein